MAVIRGLLVSSALFFAFGLPESVSFFLSQELIEAVIVLGSVPAPS